mmetsp:Transcript_26549/g.32185  ORF Transcript_26549/g.32185 Transcript_26549/m.32185 type:complete len:277 (-) Transcript_26549:169-999(-)|eukprot:CAMPEP_0197854710 /NCGR_PEP_ID=MMETSP1438-20131217/25174_1 /TAXON_ID=1461541 /ORGANISM="Pterosperma sp., Strain CCMP1384" /LENGTH=276 /DNA_ID=CAMNT_0043469547 /DNA_START=168 /DNA_END=998 /DNA_ORIENTATION=-
MSNSLRTGAAAFGVTVAAAVIYMKLNKTLQSSDPVQRAKEFLSTKTDRRGNKLADSKSEYFEGVSDYKLLLTKEEIEAGVAKVAAEIDQRFKGEQIVLCGILKGAFIFMTDLVKRLERPYSVYFVEASSYKGQKQSDAVELLSMIVPSKFKGRKIVLIDELLDNGHTMHTMVNHLMSELKVPRSDIVTCVLFSKALPSRSPQYEPDICGIPNLPNVWLVGYGLDDNGTKRGWTELFAKPKAPGIPKVDADKIFEDGEVGERKLRELRARIVSDMQS